MSCISGGDDSEAGASHSLGSISLHVGCEVTYDPEKHCILCLEAGSTFNPLNKLTTSENGRSKIVKVTVNSFALSRLSAFCVFYAPIKLVGHIPRQTVYQHGSSYHCHQAAEIREDKKVLDRANLSPNGFKYHTKLNRCYKVYVHKRKLEAIAAKKRAWEEIESTKVSYVYFHYIVPLFPIHQQIP
jgi:hypothetical protein